MSENGKLRDSELTYVQGKIRLGQCAQAWGAFCVDVALNQGVIPEISADGGYRSIEDQIRLTGTGNHKYRPGYSIHGFGNAVDINNWTYIHDLTNVARRYGFHRTIMPSEPWHFEYDGTYNPSTPTESETTMSEFRVIKNVDSGEVSVSSPHLSGKTELERGYIVFPKGPLADAACRMYGPGDGRAHSATKRDPYVAAQSVARTVYDRYTLS